jgi:response regulator of citrate/malate metabolism
MSANEQKATVFEAIKGGAEEYLVKPVTKKEVQNIWQYVWKRASATQAADKAEVGARFWSRSSSSSSRGP